jgi:hypothetical protein
VRRLALVWALAALAATIAYAVARAVEPGRGGLELYVYLLVLGALALLAFLSALRQLLPRAEGSALEEALAERAHEPKRPPELERLEREVVLGAARAFDVHYRLRPVLREIALQRLSDRRGIQLDAEADAVNARKQLGDELWELVRPDRDPPAYHHAKGPGLPAVAGFVERLEEI